MKILYIHTRYLEKGGEDVVYINEKKLMESAGNKTESVLFSNKKYTVLKFFLLLFNPFSFFRVYKAITKFKPDIIHVHNWYFSASPSIFIAAKLKRVPIVLTVHNFRILCPSAVFFSDNKIYKHSINRPFPMQPVFKRVNRNSVLLTFWLLLSTRINYFFGTWGSIDKFICLTNDSKIILTKSYLNINANNLVVKPNFVEATPLNKLYQRQDYFLYVGRLTEAKGLLVLINAIKNSSYSLHIIGDGPLKSFVEEICLNHKNIKYFYFQNKEEIIKAMQKSAAVIFPSICYEPFGLVIIEAFSCATPVIASNLGGPGDLVKDGFNGLHFEAGSTNDLTIKIHQFINLLPAEKAAFGSNAYDCYKNNYTPDNNLNQLTSIYGSLLNN